MKRYKLIVVFLMISVFVALLSTSSGIASSPDFSSNDRIGKTTLDDSDRPEKASGIVTLGAWRNLRPTESYLRSVSLLPATYSVDCSSPGQASQGWIVGDSSTILSYCNGVWDHSISTVSIPTRLYDVQALEPELGVSVGEQGAVLLYLWDFIAQDWVWIKSPIPVGNKTLYSVSMVSDGSNGYVGWAVGGADNGKGTLIYGTATPALDPGGDPTFSYTWQNMTANYPALPDVDMYFNVQMLSQNNGWAVGGVNSVKGTIIHWNGSTWSLFQEIGTDSLLGLYMLSANEGWASSRSGEIFYFNGSTWTQVASPINEVLYSIAFSPDEQEGWIVGENGTLLKYVGGNWTLFTDLRTDPFDFVGVDFTSGHGWIAGYHYDSEIDMDIGGQILEYDDDLWLAVTPPTDNRINEISIISDNDAWAVGHADNLGGTIIHWDGKHWQRWYQTDPPIPAVHLFTIDMVSETDGWAAGDPPVEAEPAVFLHWDGVRWVPPRYSAPLNVRTRDIDMLDENFGWAVAHDGNAVAKYDSYSDFWSANHTCQGIFYQLRSVSIIPDEDYSFGWDAWTAGRSTNPLIGEYFLHYEDTCGGSFAWQNVQHPPQCPGDSYDQNYMFKSNIHGIQLFNDDVTGNWGYAVGNYNDRGSIYYYDESVGSWATDWCMPSDSSLRPSKLYSVDIVEESEIVWFGGYVTEKPDLKEVWIRYLDELGYGNIFEDDVFPINGWNIYHRPIASLKMSSDTMGWAAGDRESTVSVIYQYPYPNFTLEGVPEARAVMPGGTATYQISVYSLGGFNSNVSLDVLAVPTGSSFTITPGSIDTTINAQLDIVTGGSTPLGTYLIPVEGYAVFHSGDWDIPVWRYEYLKLTVTNHPVTAVDPLKGPAGTIVTISGTNFGADPGVGNRSTPTNHVILAGQQMPDASVLSWSNTQITVQVPDNPSLFPNGPVTDEVKVMVAGEYSNADFNFQLENYITDLSYEDTGTEFVVTLTGTSFGNDPGSLYRSTTFEHISLGGNWIANLDVTSWSNNTIIFRVPYGTSGGAVTVTSNGYQSNSVAFYPPGSIGYEVFLPLAKK